MCNYSNIVLQDSVDKSSYESSHIELRRVIKQAQMHCPAQMSYSNEILFLKTCNTRIQHIV